MRISILPYLVACLILVFAGTNLNAQPARRIAVLDFSANNINESYAKAARNKIEVGLYRSNLTVLERKSIMKTVFPYGEGMMCQNTQCAVKHGRTLSADFIVMGDITFAGHYIITVRLVDVSNGNIVYADSLKSDAEKQISAITRTIADNLSSYIIDNIIKPSQGNARNWPLNNNQYKYYLTANAGYALPVSFLSNIAKHGYTIDLAGGFIVRSFGIGLKTAVCRLHDYDNRLYTSMYPVMVNANYSFVKGLFFVSPGISAGITYNYIRKGGGGIVEAIVNPELKTGLIINKVFCMYIHVNYHCIIEKRRGIQLFAFGIGMGGLW